MDFQRVTIEPKQCHGIKDNDLDCVFHFFFGDCFCFQRLSISSWLPVCTPTLVLILLQTCFFIIAVVLSLLWWLFQSPGFRFVASFFYEFLGNLFFGLFLYLCGVSHTTTMLAPFWLSLVWSFLYLFWFSIPFARAFACFQDWLCASSIFQRYRFN